MADMEQMGREVVAVTGWLPGMLARSGAYAIRARGDGPLEAHVWPDLTDPATQGCVMGWLRDRYGVECVWMEPQCSPPGWAVQVYHEDISVQREHRGAGIPGALHAAVMAGGEADAVGTLAAHARGEVGHAYLGRCPDTVEGADARDPDCPVCRALLTLEADDG